VELWFAAFLGVLQGLTEFLPISSTAHLRLAPTLLGQPDPGAAFTAVIQLGSLVAVIAYFARDLFVDLPRAMLRDRHSPDGRLPFYLALGTIPIVVAGLALQRFITGDARSLYVVAGALIGVGVILLVIDARAAKRGTRRPLADLQISDAVLIGLAQACALIPGVSRSGATICMALVLGFSRPDAARFSFLLSIPAIAGAGVFEMKDAMRGLGGDAMPALAVGTVAAALSSYLAIAWLMKWLGKHRLAVFGGYRILLGAIVLALLAAGMITPEDRSQDCGVRRGTTDGTPAHVPSPPC
jgi:undecaprenyl-diphosphatase